MDIDMRTEGEALLVSLKGRLDTLTTPEVDKALAEPLESCANCALDLAAVDYISSSGLRLLLRLYKKMEAEGGRLVLRNAQPGVLDILEMTGFASFLTLE